MDKETLERIRKLTKDKITISNFQKDKVMEKNKINVKRLVSVASIAIILTTGVVFAEEITEFIKYHFTNKIVEDAANSGYVGEINSNTIEEETTLVEEDTGFVINDVGVSVKFDEFVMDDLTLSTNMTMTFDEKIKEVFELDKLQHIAIKDLMILDEENRILLTTGTESDFNRLCKEYNLSQKFAQWGEDYYNCPFGKGIVSHDKETNTIKYNIDISASDRFFPKSKKLRFVFSKIYLERFEEYTGQNIEAGEYLESYAVTLKGDWMFEVDVPEKMYNRTKIGYEVLSISHPNMEVYASEASETGFELGVIVTGEVEPEFPQFEYLNEITDKYKNGELSDDEFNQKYNEFAKTEEYQETMNEFHNEREPIRNWTFFMDPEMENKLDYVSNIKNEKGKVFYTAFRMQRHEFIEGNKFDYFDVYEMSKADLTDKLTVTLFYRDEPVIIELQKIK